MDLPFLACAAAIELHALARGMPNPLDLRSVADLARTFSDKWTDPGGIPRSAFLADPSTSVVVWRAILDAMPAAGPIQWDHQLEARVDEIAGRLRDTAAGAKGGGKPDDDGVEQLAAFCLALSKHAADSETSAYPR
jgi:hypothetical protein